ncbi:FecCD family ABC transporter permease [Butyrivibrio sp. FCS014]|uniref:FecCD family ABC transporter permease n=1 Tax=Butyrivibrio sp. FCS014 TaxID=1408304 RepID=UPI0004665D8A|nr:iron ABC transporter permease [Butyrivibrio sp. FCS014]
MTNNLEIDLKNIYRKHDRLNTACIVALLVIIAALGVMMMTLGNTNYSLKEVVTTLLSSGSKGAAYNIKTIRLPKLIVGGFAGFAFGIAGYTFQNLLRNPLASPDIIGVSAGSSAAAVFCILILGISGPLVSIVAVAAGLIITTLIFVLSGKGHFFGSRMILIGIGMQAVLNALISWMLLVGSEYDVSTALRWLRGSLNLVQMSDAFSISFVTIIGSALLLICNRYLRMMQLGEEYATTLGVPLSAVRICCMVCALVISATAASITGPIASVAFLSGPIAGKCTKNGKNAMVVAGLIGTILVYASELAGKNLFAAKYPVGVITGLLGAPYLLLLLLNLNKKGEKI